MTPLPRRKQPTMKQHKANVFPLVRIFDNNNGQYLKPEDFRMDLTGKIQAADLYCIVYPSWNIYDADKEWYTGWCDTDSKPIYGHDVVKITMAGGQELLGVVYRNNNRCWCVATIHDYTIHFTTTTAMMEQCHIVGNIHSEPYGGWWKSAKKFLQIKEW